MEQENDNVPNHINKSHAILHDFCKNYMEFLLYLEFLSFL